MSLYPDNLIIIFAGYKDLLLDTIFKAQPGLQRRIGWFFEIEDYSRAALARIFKSQLCKNNWKLDKDVNIEEIIVKHKHIIKNPGDTEKLVLQTKIAYAETYFLQNVKHESIITKDMIISAIDKHTRNAPQTTNNVPFHMYL